MVRDVLAVVMMAVAMAHASEPAYAEWAVAQIDAFLAGGPDAAAGEPISWHAAANGAWTAGVASVRSTAHGEGILVVPDSASGLAYLAFRNRSRYATTAEAHTLGLGFCPFLTTKTEGAVIEFEPDAGTWAAIR